MGQYSLFVLNVRSNQPTNRTYMFMEWEACAFTNGKVTPGRIQRTGTIIMDTIVIVADA